MWCEGTSTNISIRYGNKFLISTSGLDKQNITENDFILVNKFGLPLSFSTKKPSAETLLHLAIYEKNPKINAVIHTHSVNSTLLTESRKNSSLIDLPKVEMLKGIKGVESHLQDLNIPVFCNNQNMKELALEYKDFNPQGKIQYGLLLRGHGLYSYGATLEEAKRHSETYECLFDYLIKFKSMK